jgi:signal transduction histidine kinase
MKDYANRTLHCPVDFHSTVLEALRRTWPLAQEHGVTILGPPTQTTESDAAVEVLGDQVLLKEMVELLVRFAQRFTPDGGCVELDIRCRGDSMVLSVRDRGLLAAAERLEPALDWFDVLPGERRSWGLDFSIAKRLAGFHHGTTTLRDRTNGGCECEVTLPRWRPAGAHFARSV